MATLEWGFPSPVPASAYPEDIMGSHARNAPSGADIWMQCAASIEMQAREPNGSNEFAAEGTVAHDVQEKCLTYGLDPHAFLGQIHTVFDEDDPTIKYEILIKEEMAEFLQPVIDEIRDTPGEHYYETRVMLGQWLPPHEGEEQGGTLDVGIVDVKRNLIIIRDLKYGRGVPVSPVENRQLRIYALGFWWMVRKMFPRGAKPRFRIIIDQPRNYGGGGTWECSFDELMEFGIEVSEKAKETFNPKLIFTPGDKQCTYCRAAQNLHCKAYDEFQAAKADLKLKDFSKGPVAVGKMLPDPDNMTAKKRAEIMAATPVLRQWLKRIHTIHLQECLSGHDGGGLKAVAGRRGHRKWSSVKQARTFLLDLIKDEDEIWKPPELISPAMAEKLIGNRILTEEPPLPKNGRAPKRKPIICDFIMQDDGRPVLVPESDPKPKLIAYSAALKDFSDEDDDDDF